MTYFLCGFAFYAIMPNYYALFVFFSLLFFCDHIKCCLIALGLMYLPFYQFAFLPNTASFEFENKVVHLSGRLLEIPSQTSYGQASVFKVDKLNNKPWSGLISLKSYQRDIKLKIDKYYDLIAKVKTFRNFENPGSRNFKAYQKAKKIVLSGYIKRLERETNLKPNAILAWRYHILNTIDALTDDLSLRSLLKSLSIGYRQSLSLEEKQLYRDTGTSHLFAISGLHVGMVASIFYFCFNFLWRLSARCCLLCRADRMASMMAINGALLYALLAGFEVSTQRALVMLGTFLLAQVLHFKVSRRHSFFLALLFVILLNPMSIYLPGFYLSFYVVAVILLCMDNRRGQFFRLQWQISLLVLPLGYYFFSQASLSLIHI